MKKFFERFSPQKKKEADLARANMDWAKEVYLAGLFGDEGKYLAAYLDGDRYLNKQNEIERKFAITGQEEHLDDILGHPGGDVVPWPGVLQDRHLEEAGLYQRWFAKPDRQDEFDLKQFAWQLKQLERYKWDILAIVKELRGLVPQISKWRYCQPIYILVDDFQRGRWLIDDFMDELAAHQTKMRARIDNGQQPHYDGEIGEYGKPELLRKYVDAQFADVYDAISVGRITPLDDIAQLTLDDPVVSENSIGLRCPPIVVLE